MVRYVVNRPVTDDELNRLFDAAWSNYRPAGFSDLLQRSVVHVEAFREDELVGFVRVVRCGRSRGFVLGPTVHPDAQRQGVGTALLETAATASKEEGIESLHVEFEGRHRGFYRKAGFTPTPAGVRHL